MKKHLNSWLTWLPPSALVAGAGGFSAWFNLWPETVCPPIEPGGHEFVCGPSTEYPPYLIANDVWQVVVWGLTIFTLALLFRFRVSGWGTVGLFVTLIMAAAGLGFYLLSVLGVQIGVPYDAP